MSIKKCHSWRRIFCFNVERETRERRIYWECMFRKGWTLHCEVLAEEHYQLMLMGIALNFFLFSITLSEIVWIYF